MSLSRDEIVEHLQRIVGGERVLTDPHLLQQRSIDNFRKLQNIFGVYTMPTPAAVVMVRDTQEVSNVLEFADSHGVNVVARTGGTATEGGLETPVENSIVVDGSQMNEIIKIDAYNMQATVQCGVPLQVLEDRARALGLTTGHSPQSKPVAQMGGLVATRSIGQFSTLYGGIEDMVAGVEVVFAGGGVSRIKNVPRRAAGPDIRHIVIGNEGALCFITEVTVKLFPYMPENNMFLGWRLKSMKTGFEVLREVMVAGYKPSVARLYDPEDGQLHFSSFAAPDDCVLLFMAEGAAGIAKATADGIAEIVGRRAECVPVESRLIAEWFDDLVWGVDKISPRGRADPHHAQCQPHHRDLRGLELDQRHLRGCARQNSPRDPRHHVARWPLVAQLHQRDEHVLQLLLRSHRLRSRRRDDEVLPADHLDHLRGDTAVRRIDRPPPRNRQGPGPHG